MVTSRQKLIWLLLVASGMALFMAYQNQTTMEHAITDNGILHKGFRVHNLNIDENGVAKNPIRQISLIGERNSGTKWMWA